MPSSFVCLHYHLVFSTRHRQPQITPDIAPRLYEYFAGTMRGQGGHLLLGGGMPDHVHLLVRLGASRALADVLRETKAGSSKWGHETFPHKVDFSWQTGYGAFAVSASSLEDVQRYIANQEQHHQQRSFQDEFVLLLKRHEIEFDPRYLWDD